VVDINRNLCLSFKEDELDSIIKRRRAIRCLNNGKVYESVLEAAIELNVDKYALYDSLILNVEINNYKFIKEN